MRYINNFLKLNLLLGFLLAIGAALGFSLKAIFVKLSYGYGVDAITLLMLRMAFSLPFFVVIAFFEERKLKDPLPMKTMLLIALMGLIGYYLSSTLDFIGLQFISAGLERLILFAYPTLVLLISVLFLGKKIYKEAMIACVLSYSGIGLAVMHDFSFAGEHVLLGSSLIFMATLSYAVFLVGSGELIPRVGSRRFAAYAMIVSCLAVFLQFFLLRDVGVLMNQAKEVYAYALAMAIFSTVIPSFLLAAAIQRIGASYTSIMGFFGPIATIAIAALVLNEAVSSMQILGAVLIIGGVFALGLKKS
ncbi:MAG: DMT family transporter [Mariprofundaceae bacterium]|nr:DMT family transporter [Mariprofundaceae bacterium]